MKSNRITKILISVDHRWRDLPGHSYLAEILEQRYNYKVILVRDGDEVKYWQAFKPNVIIINHLLERHKRNWIKTLPPQIKVIILPTEGITAYTKDMKNLLGGNRAEYRLITALLSWVSFLDSYWSEDCFLEREKIFPVGVSRFDFFFEPKIQSVFRNPDYLKKNLKIPSDKKIITFFLNFVYATTAARNIKLWEKILINQGYDPQPYIKRAFEDLKARENFLQTVEEIRKKFPQYYLLVKPHPNEDYHFYKKHLKKSSQVRIVCNLYSIEALFLSDLVIQRRCTTGLEAAILNKLAIDYSYEESFVYDGDLVKGIWPEAQNKDELINLISLWEKNDFRLWQNCEEEGKDRLKKWVYLNKGQATQKAAEVVHMLAQNTMKYNLSNAVIFKNKIKYYGISLIKDIYRKIFPDRWGRYNKAPNFFDFWLWRRKIRNLLENND